MEVTVRTESGAPMHTTPLADTQVRGPVHSLVFNPGIARDAVAFLDGERVDVHASPHRLATYPRGERRHAIVMQLAV